jgi:hypothetical protein
MNTEHAGRVLGGARDELVGRETPQRVSAIAWSRLQFLKVTIPLNDT